MKTVISTPNAPQAIGPYSQGIQTETLIFTAGQLGLDPATGQLVEGVAEQTRQAMRNIRAILTAAGSSLDRIVKTTIFIMNMSDFKTVNAAYAEFFPGTAPARSTIQVAGLPLEGLVEIETVALSSPE